MNYECCAFCQNYFEDGKCDLLTLRVPMKSIKNDFVCDYYVTDFKRVRANLIDDIAIKLECNLINDADREIVRFISVQMKGET